jgi:hypothetical protein
MILGNFVGIWAYNATQGKINVSSGHTFIIAVYYSENASGIGYEPHPLPHDTY